VALIKEAFWDVIKRHALKKQKNFWCSAKQILNNAAFIGF